MSETALDTGSSTDKTIKEMKSDAQSNNNNQVRYMKPSVCQSNMDDLSMKN